MFKRATGATTYADVKDIARWNGTGYTLVTFGRRWNGSSWTQVWPAVGLIDFQLSQSNVTGLLSCNGVTDTCPFVARIVSDSVTASASSGTPTFLWQYESGDTGITVSNSTAATVTFSANVARQVPTAATWKCTVTSGAESKDLFVDIVLFYDYQRRPGEIVP